MRVASPAPGGTGRRNWPPPVGGGAPITTHAPIPSLRANIASRIAGLFARTDAKILVSDFCPVRDAKILVSDFCPVRDAKILVSDFCPVRDAKILALITL